MNRSSIVTLVNPARVTEVGVPKVNFKTFDGEKSILEIVSSAEHDSSIARRVDLFSLTANSGSAVVGDVMKRLSASDSAQLRVYGLAWRLAEGDAAAVRESCRLSAELWEEPLQLGAFSSAVREYVNTDRGAVAALGPFLGNPDAPNLAEQEHLHIGAITEPGQEARLLTYWKQWWQQQRPEYPEPEP